MAADQERADRIRALKQGRPDLTWRRIADHVGVTERSATDWQTKGGMEYANAVKLAELFEVDVDYIWRGVPAAERAPGPFDAQDALADRLDAIETAIAEMRAERAREAERVEALIEKQNKLLARQSLILEKIEAAIDRDDQAAAQITAASESLDGAAERLDAQVQQTIRDLRSAPVDKPRAARKTAPKRSPRASS